MRRKEADAPDPTGDQRATAQQHIRSTLEAVPAGSRGGAYTLFSAACADRLFRWYDARPANDRRPYSLTWRPVLDDIWSHLGGDATAYSRISRALGEFYLSPYSNNNGQDGPDDIDQDEAAAAFFTANCLMHEMVGFALLSSSRAISYLDARWFGLDEDERREQITAEIRRQLSDGDAIAAAAQMTQLGRAVPADLIAELRG